MDPEPGRDGCLAPVNPCTQLVFFRSHLATRIRACFVHSGDFGGIQSKVEDVGLWCY